MNNFPGLLQKLQIATLFKTGFLVADVIFVIFLIVVIKQVLTMNTIVSNDNDSSLIKSASFLLLIINVSLFLTALVIL
jgi:hypothetical protein